MRVIGIIAGLTSRTMYPRNAAINTISIWKKKNKKDIKKFPKSLINAVQELRKKCKNVFGREDLHVDLFPAVETSSGNVGGKQVKLPLSCHRSGGRSYLFRGEFEIVDDRFNEAFIGDQTRILSEYITNDIEFVEKQLGIDCTEDDSYTYKYKKYGRKKVI